MGPTRLGERKDLGEGEMRSFEVEACEVIVLRPSGGPESR